MNQHTRRAVRGMEVSDQKNLNAAAEQIVKELSSHNIRFSELDQIIEMVKEKISKQPIIASQ